MGNSKIIKQINPDKHVKMLRTSKCQIKISCYMGRISVSVARR